MDHRRVACAAHVCDLDEAGQNTKRLIPLLALLALLTACDTQSERDRAEAQRLQAAAQLAQAQAKHE
jgi:hypothetical protein